VFLLFGKKKEQAVILCHMAVAVVAREQLSGKIWTSSLGVEKK
jgi:hypothetical protein